MFKYTANEKCENDTDGKLLSSYFGDEMKTTRIDENHK